MKRTLDALIVNFKQNIHPSRNLSVDETMVGFRGRYGAKQYMPNKPNKYGIKAFTLADSSNGYILDIIVYTGADTLPDCPNIQHLPQPAKIVQLLVNDYLDEGRVVFTDHYYTSIPLAQALESRSTAFTGTCMKNRQQIPPQFRQASF